MIDPARLAVLRRQIDAPPERHRLPLRLALGRDRADARIGSIEPELGRALAGAGLPIRPDESGWRIDPADDASRDAMLAAFAATLRDLGRAAAWRDERLAVADEGGAVVAAIERAAVRPLGIATHAVHLVAHRPDGRVWVQRRALDKSTDPGLWDTTMGGLVAAGESLRTAFEREAWEEAGLAPAALRDARSFGRFTVRRPVAHGFMVEHTELLEAVIEAHTTPVNQDGEVERFDCVDRPELVRRLTAGDFTLEAELALAMWLGPRDRPA